MFVCFAFICYWWLSVLVFINRAIKSWSQSIELYVFMFYFHLPLAIVYHWIWILFQVVLHAGLQTFFLIARHLAKVLSGDLGLIGVGLQLRQNYTWELLA